MTDILTNYANAKNMKEYTQYVGLIYLAVNRDLVSMVLKSGI